MILLDITEFSSVTERGISTAPRWSGLTGLRRKKVSILVNRGNTVQRRAGSNWRHRYLSAIDGQIAAVKLATDPIKSTTAAAISALRSMA
jgi:cation transport ATPase